MLARTLTSLSRACVTARSGARLDTCRILLTDHSPLPADEADLARWRECIASAAELDYRFVDANPGFGIGHNQAFSLGGAGHDYFLVANPDIEPAPDSLAAGMDCLSANPQAGLLAPALQEDDDSIRPACFRYPDVLTLLTRFHPAGRKGWRSVRYECRDWNANDREQRPLLTSGCCMLFRSSAFERLGGFDPGYFLYFEDLDLSLRASRLGMSAYCPAMRIRHHGGGVANKGLRHIAYFMRSACRFFHAHGWRWA